jgi:tRNA pseudouridine55 synthase
MGERLGCGAYLSALERTRIGPFRVADAVTLEELGAYRTLLAAKPS